MSKIYEIKMSPPIPITINKKLTDTFLTIPINSKKYTLSSSPINYESDEITISIDEVYKNTDYHIVYDNNDNTYYNIFKVYIECNHLICKGIDSFNLNEYKGIKVMIDFESDVVNHCFTVYSKNIKEMMHIKIKNQYNINLNLDDQVVYYPIYIVCYNNYLLYNFIDIYPHLVKNIFKFNL